MKKWEYKVINSKNCYVGLSQPDLNKLGEQGWELIYIQGSQYKTYIFKREKE